MNASQPPELQPRPRTYRLLAIIALVFSILPLTAILGLIAGIVSLVLSRKRPAQFGGKRLATTAVILAMLWVLGIAGFIFIGIPRLQRMMYTQNNCSMHARSLTSSLRIISIANSGAFPSAETWCDALSREVSSKEHFKCSDDPQHAACGFAYNAKLSGVKDPDPRTVMIFESDLGWNGSGGASNAVAKARHNGFHVRMPRGTNAPSKRPFGARGPFVVVGFADGRSVQAIAIEDLPLLRWDP
jgi:hypothetical protein